MKKRFHVTGVVHASYAAWVESDDPDEAAEESRELIYGGDLHPDDDEIEITSIDEDEDVEEA